MKQIVIVLMLALAAGCAAPEPEGLAPAGDGAGARVKFDLFHKPLPDIPFPNDIATRYDPSSPTGRRVNASVEVAVTEWEKATRRAMDELDGWGTFAPLHVSFDAPLDVDVIYQRHRDNYDFTNDAVYVVNVTRGSPDFCQPAPLDMGEGNFPLTLERQAYYPNDPRNGTNQLVFEEVEEDLNRNGSLDPGEDTDMDGVLDHPNTRFPDADPQKELMTFYERETNTLIMRPLMPLRERTAYAVVLTRRLKDVNGLPVRSPFAWINHTAQTPALQPLLECLPQLGLETKDVAFTWSFTTQSITADLKMARDGLYGLGPMAHLAQDYPLQLTDLHNIRRGFDNAKVVTGAQFVNFAKRILPLLMGGESPELIQSAIDSHQFIGFHAVGSFESPQLFPRFGSDGKMLPFYEQFWRIDPIGGAEVVRPEKITFWLTVPKKEYARRPAPLIILGHGYTGAKLDPIMYGGYFARQGMATLGMECPSHGMPLGPDEAMLVRGAAETDGLDPMADALLIDRAFDQNGDGIKDSGVDYWTAYVFHTRDMVRQSALDYMRAVQLLRSFDGVRRWQFDVDRDGTPELAGDFDADGEVDVGGSAHVGMVGGSLGGIMSAVVGGIEPQVTVIAPISGGGGLGDIGLRSIQGGVAEAVNLRMMGPLLVTERTAEGQLELWQYVPDGNRKGRVMVAAFDAASEPQELETVVATNKKTGEYRCAQVQKGGLLRVAVSSDAGDPLSLAIYPGVLPPAEKTGCELREELAARLTIESFGPRDEAKKGYALAFQGVAYPLGSPLVALGDGFGIRRGTPEMRRFIQIAQTVLDPGDPVNYAPYYERWRMQHTTGEVVHTRACVINTIGDMNVPMSTGAAIARAAGFIPFSAPDGRWGDQTANQVLIDQGAYEATERTRRHLNASGQSVLADVEHLSSIGANGDGFDVPRLSPPMRLMRPSQVRGGYSGTLMPLVIPTGKHGFDPPDPAQQFDLGALMFNALGHYLATEGREYNLDPCNLDFSCPYLPPLPPQ